MIRVAIAGATGYTGAELVRILLSHSKVELTVLTSRQYAGTSFDQAFPSMAGSIDLVCEAFSVDSICEKADVVFLALPHKLPLEFVPQFINRGKRVIDLSADFRFKNVETYEAYYQPHPSKEYLKKSVYGLSEVYTEQIKTAQLIGNPGCYPTSTLLPLIPLIKKKLINPQTIIADSKSGVSGAGRSVSITTHFCEVNESFKAYKVGTHRHTPEIEEILSHEAGEPVSITFVPHLVPMTRGMLTTIYVSLKSNMSEDDVRNIISEYYVGRPFIRLCPSGKVPDTLYVKGTNYCDIGIKIDRKNNRLILISAIDNLVKGASGQAVQNMNIMMGFDETEGLKTIPYPL